MLDALFSTTFRVALLLYVAMAAGDCYATRFPLGPQEKATVDPAFCGNWQTQDGKDHILIANFNNHLYLVQQSDEDGKPSSYASFIVDVKGVHFAHNGILTADGKPPEAWVLQRVELKDNQLVIRDLNKTYFESKAPETAGALRKLIEDHVNDDAIYAGSGNVLVRVPE